MTEFRDPPSGVSIRRVDGSIVAQHEATDVSSHGETKAEAIQWLAEAVALEVGFDGEVDDAVEFLETQTE